MYYKLTFRQLPFFASGVPGLVGFSSLSSGTDRETSPARSSGICQCESKTARIDPHLRHQRNRDASRFPLLVPARMAASALPAGRCQCVVPHAHVSASGTSDTRHHLSEWKARARGRRSQGTDGSGARAARSSSARWPAGAVRSTRPCSPKDYRCVSCSGAQSPARTRRRRTVTV